MGPLMGGFAHAKFDAASYAMTGDGNSIMDPNYSDMLTQLQAMAPISGGFTISNFGISGQTTQQMLSNHADVDASFVAGKVNFLLAWELTNNIHNANRTGLQTCSDMTDYITAVKAIHPWRVILMTGIPRGDHFGTLYTATTGETEMQAANAYIRANYKAMGAIALVEARRTGGPFDFTDCTNAANFPASLWTDKTHPNSAGKGILAGYIADTMKRLPAR